MIMKEIECSGGSMDCGSGIMGRNGDVGFGFAAVVENGVSGGGNSGGSSQETLRTYKRRKYNTRNNSQTKLLSNWNIAANMRGQLSDKKVKGSVDMVLHNCSHAVGSGSDGSLMHNSRNIVLSQLYQSLPDIEGGLLGCLLDKASVRNYGDNEKCTSPMGRMINGTHNHVKGHLGEMCNGSLSKSSSTNTDLCRQVFGDIVSSEKFSQLCGLLLGNFEGIKVNCVLDISLINSRMKDGTYETSPIVFHSDMQQLWTRLQKVGADIIHLSKSLMDKSKASYSQQFPDMESDLRAKSEQIEIFGAPKVCSCRRCGEKAEVRDCLVCDACEEMYHVSCIEPAVEEIPLKSWYCINCVANDIESPHDNCVVCAELNVPIPATKGVGDSVLASKQHLMKPKEDLNGLDMDEFKLRKGGNQCNICRTEVDHRQKLKVCGHSFCPHKYYHVKCLTYKQLNTYGPCWYCPSCLCRACLTDQDDDKIVLCDGCDSAYHLYCMQPPRTTVPRTSWFCVECNLGIQKITKAKRAYERTHGKLEKRGKDGNGVLAEEAVYRSGGMDMLLTAARTLKYEENMAASEMES